MGEMDKIKERLIVALDVNDEIQAFDIVEELKNDALFYKVGLELFLAEGKKLVNVLRALNRKVFLDLKFFDIPNTVYGATKQALKLKPEMLTFHCLGGSDMLKSAVKAKQELKSHTNLLGVTLLTSMDIEDLHMNDSSKFVLTMARQALSSGLDGIVCSAQDVEFLRRELGTDFLIVCPGIRLEESGDDQKRVGTPKQAVEAGADYLVIGRPILQAKDKSLAFNKIISSIL